MPSTAALASARPLFADVDASIMFSEASVLPFDASDWTSEAVAQAPEASSVALSVATPADEVKIEVDGRNIRIVGAAGMVLEVFNVTGQRVAVYKIEGAEKTVQLGVPRGCYILRVGKATRKVSYL